jgi:hypothetical protein
MKGGSNGTNGIPHIGSLQSEQLESFSDRLDLAPSYAEGRILSSSKC